MTRPFLSAALGLACLLATAGQASNALAWGATGHRLIGRLAVDALPPSLPAFLHSKEAIETVGEYAREPDRWKGTGATPPTSPTSTTTARSSAARR